ncbi:YdgH/BhsA/McbA-like domain containing protein [Xenorhabdus sp. PB62.4]|uniref:multiple stress resistance protein BhsA n=1 Tax=Xenorhabdus sp. PB62.4 TaxID=1851573 RepID=UPI00165694EA|nr:YdgH/BhsA/McbA-like domain containing protein [Xenorhabdus sp. PB62.4]MBC8954459.1 Multiple stress resistance protein BhsA [Xenorhabdus sp. PB62.4]
MKTSRYITPLFLLSAISFGSSAASEVKSAVGEKIGVISVTGAETLDTLIDKLSKKASEAGAKHFRITSAVGKNHLNGTAEIYR